MGQGRLRVAEPRGGCGRHAGPLHLALRERLARLEARGRPGRAEGRDPRRRQLVGHARRERCLRADDHEVVVLPGRVAYHGRGVEDVEVARRIAHLLYGLEGATSMERAHPREQRFRLRLGELSLSSPAIGTLERLGIVYRSQRRFAEARRFLDWALRLYLQQEKAHEAGIVWLHLAITATYEPDPDAAERQRQADRKHRLPLAAVPAHEIGELIATLALELDDVGLFRLERWIDHEAQRTAGFENRAMTCMLRKERTLGLAPGLCAGERQAMAQATHGSAPDIAGRNIANPYALIMSGKMLLEWLGRKRNEPRAVEAAQRIDAAMDRVIAEAKHLTADLGGRASTTQMGDAVAAAV